MSVLFHQHDERPAAAFPLRSPLLRCVSARGLNDVTQRLNTTRRLQPRSGLHLNLYPRRLSGASIGGVIQAARFSARCSGSGFAAASDSRVSFNYVSTNATNAAPETKTRRGGGIQSRDIVFTHPAVLPPLMAQSSM
jgi:hypothetical protein